MAKTADAEQTLGQYLAERIRRNGPMTFHDWMEAALYDEERGYYRREDLERWGREGDYRTAPETSVLFAATFARYFATLFQNAQEDLTVVEVGAGAGHFAAGLLDTLSRRYPSLFHRITYLIDEINQHARARIALRTAKFAPRIQFKRLSEIDSLNPGIIFA
ncbi:MAG TPA: SAM-dependent methyltransferase, partial [Pyrinomonadaceae bacterium]